MLRRALTSEEVTGIADLLADVVGRFASADDPAFLREAGVLAGELPRGTRAFFNAFRLAEPPDAPACVLSGHPIDDTTLGPTPTRWQVTPDEATRAQQMLLVLYGALFGDPFAWSTQQRGHVVHDLFPIPEDAHRQLGSGSEGLLWWHTEDAFHPCRCDYLGLLCLRNPNRAATMVGSNRAVRQLDAATIGVLFEPRFTIRPDESHLAAPEADGRDEGSRLARASVRMQQMDAAPEPLAALFGDPADPYMRVDPFFMRALDAEAAHAMAALVQAVDGETVDLILEPGDVCFIDNYRAVHGRRPFVPGYNGNDRWLKRINVTRDLRKSRAARLSSDARVLY